MSKWFGNDFDTAIAIPAETAFQPHGFTLIGKKVSDSFDNGWVSLGSPDLTITFVRDRSYIEVLFTPPGSSENFDFEALRRVIDGNVSYQAGMEKYGGKFSVAGKFPAVMTQVITFLPQIRAVLQPSALPKTCDLIERILQNRVSFLLPGWR